MNENLRKLFDEGAERRGTGCEKWDHVSKYFGHEDVLPLFVADMRQKVLVLR